MLRNFYQDLRFSLRQFRKRPGFAITALLILALGIGANTAIFSVVNAFLIRPLPFRDPQRLTALYERNIITDDEPFNWVSPGHYLDWQKVATSFEQIAAYSVGPVNLADPNSTFQPQRVQACFCAANFIPTLGVAPLLGRNFRPDEDRYGVSHGVMLSYSLWQARFGGAPDIVGKRIRIDGESVEVIGVMPRGFSFPDRTIEAWLPLLAYVRPELQVRHDTHFLQLIGRLRPGISVGQAKAEVDGIAARFHQAHPSNVVGRGANVVPLGSALVEDVRTSLLILLGAVACVLLIACVNVANLLLTRATGRSRELCVRAAIGASRGRIIAQLLTESILLALGGAIVGALFAGAITEVLTTHAPGASTMLSTGEVSVDPRVFLFAFGVALLAGIAAGLFPALQSSRIDLVNGLKDTGRSNTPSRSHGTFRNILVGTEVAVSLVLLVAAGLLIRSFAEVARVKPGFRTDHIMTMSLSLPEATYREPAKQAAFVNQVSERMQNLPGVDSAGLVTCLPVSGHCNDRVFRIEGRPLLPGQSMDALNRSIDPGYLKTIGIPLLRGRTFTPQDGIGTDEKHPRLGAVIISELAARTFFPGEDPIGKRIFFGSEETRQQITGRPAPRHEIIGVVGDVPVALDAKIQPTMYLPLQNGADAMTVVLHSGMDPNGVVAAARREIEKMDPDLAVFDIRSMDQVLNSSTTDREFNVLLLGSFAALAVILAAVGLYGVLSYAVSQRRGEIGIRMALGANASEVSAWVLKQGMKPAIAGVVAGVAGALLLSRVLKSLLFGVTPLDPLTFIVVPVVLLAISALASYLPAVRAARVDPTSSLRSE